MGIVSTQSYFGYHFHTEIFWVSYLYMGILGIVSVQRYFWYRFHTEIFWVSYLYTGIFGIVSVQRYFWYRFHTEVFWVLFLYRGIVSVAISMFSPISSLSSNGLRMRVCMYSTATVQKELICGYVNVVHTSSSFCPHTHSHSYHLRTTN